MTTFNRIERWEDIPRAISQMQRAGVDHQVPLLQRLYRGEIAYLPIVRPGSAGLFKRWTAAARLPAIALVGDDDHAAPDGPDTWPIARRVLQWARFVLIHGGAGRPEHYEFAVELAKRHGRLALVECTSARVADWEAAGERWAAQAGGLVMHPPPGVQHPSLDRGGLH